MCLCGLCCGCLLLRLLGVAWAVCFVMLVVCCGWLLGCFGVVVGWCGVFAMWLMYDSGAFLGLCFRALGNCCCGVVCWCCLLWIWFWLALC